MNKGTRPYLGIVLIVAVCWMVYNLCANAAQFFVASFYNILTIMIAVFFAFFMTQSLNRKRRKADAICSFLDKLEKELDNERAYLFPYDSYSEDFLLRQRRINRYILLIEGAEKQFGYDSHNLKDRVEDYNSFVGEKIDSKEYLRQSSQEIRRIIDNICNEIHKIKLLILDC